MKKLLILFVALFLSAPVFADQLAWLTKEQAEKTQKWLDKHPLKQVVLWCACCDGDAKVKVRVTKYEIRPVEGQPDYYELIIIGKTSTGEMVNTGVDLAYVHIPVKGKARCLGKEIGLECDPCTRPFKW